MKKIVNVLLLSLTVIMFALSFQSLAASNHAAGKVLLETSKIYNKEGFVAVKWKKVSDAQGYEVYKKDESGKWIKCADISAKTASYKDSSVKNGKFYSYKVRAVMKDGYSSYGKASYRYLAAPSIKSAENKTNGIYIKWKKCTVATGYKVYRQTEGSTKWKCIATIDGNTPKYTDKNVKSGVNYTYRVKQICKDYISAAKDGMKACYVAPVKALTASNSPKGITLKWSKVSGVTGYTVYRKAGGDWKKIATVKGADRTSCIDKKASYGKKNYYKVKAYISNSKQSAYSPAASIYAVDPNKPMVALTYDDGPYRPTTNRILDTLKKYGARATFFVVGSRLSIYSDCLKAENKLGCEIACHTYNHTILTSVSADTIKSEISKTNDLVKKYTGQTVKLVRAPGGSVNQTVKNAVGYPLVNWSVDTLDWRSRNASSVVSNIKNNVSDGSIVLMHDLYESTASASETIVPWLIKKGYQLVTVSEMMDAKGIAMKNSVLYTKAK